LAWNGNSAAQKPNVFEFLKHGDKTQIRNPKFETNSNDQKDKTHGQTGFGFRFGNLDLSIFDLFRISSFGFRILISWSLLEAIYFVTCSI